MRLCFICGCLEPGKDGVGDYTRQLANKLVQNGHTIWNLALNDSFVQKVTEELHYEGKYKVTILRLPSQMALSDKVPITQNWLKEINPNWISLQFVPYAFHPKGLPFFWIGFLQKLSGHSKWHIMFHELWIGSKKEDSIKTKMIGMVQRLIVKKMLVSLNPDAITTNLPYYHALLRGLNREASILPVFSNLPFGSFDNHRIIDRLPVEVQQNRQEWLVAAMFGGISLHPEINTRLEKLVHKAISEKKKLLLVHVGRPGHSESFFNYIKTKNLCSLIVLGEQPAADIASFFLSADFGISTYEAAFLEKSGSVAAMLYNKLPVVLLKKSIINSEFQYPYAKCIDDIELLTSFYTQSKEWSTLFSLQNAAAFYNDIFTQKQ